MLSMKSRGTMFQLRMCMVTRDVLSLRALVFPPTELPPVALALRSEWPYYEQAGSMRSFCGYVGMVNTDVTLIEKDL